MNNRTTYEVIITEKLQQLPLPALEDAIWARISTQLDLDMPEDEGGGSGPQNPSGGWMWSAGLLAFVAALLAVFVLTQKNNNSSNPPDNTYDNTAPMTTPLQVPATAPPNGSANQEPEVLPAPLNSTTGSNAGKVAIDSANSGAASLPEQLLPDSAQPVIVQLPTQPVKDSVSKPKTKTRGVPNITDADYRIVPTKRDST
jgi:hypothetical protein